MKRKNDSALTSSAPDIHTMWEYGVVMVTGHVFIATSLDGFIARENGDIDWLLKHDESGEDHGYDDFIENIDVIVMGRGTYEAVRNMGEWFYTRPVLVLSAQLARQQVPSELSGKVRFSDKSPGNAMAMPNSEGAQRAYVDGGRIIQSFLKLGMISDMVITRVPILLGTGRPLFGEDRRDVALTHKDTRAFPSGLVQSHYEVVRRRQRGQGGPLSMERPFPPTSILSVALRGGHHLTSARPALPSRGARVLPAAREIWVEGIVYGCLIGRKVWRRERETPRETID
jgi:dihydrofolate reductase